MELQGWTIPLAYVVVTLVLGMALPRAEHHLLPGSVSSMSAPAMMGICSAVASGMITLTCIVFSLTFLMVQFGATAYSPRLVLWVARDPVMSHALGVFISTFLYSLMLLAWVDRGASGRVPFISGWLVFFLLLASMAMFIVLVERVGLLQVTRMLIFIGHQGRKSIEQFYMSAGSAPRKGDTRAYRSMPATQALAHSGPPQVIQALDVPYLVKLSAESGAVIEMTASVGDTLIDKAPLLTVYGPSGRLDKLQLEQAIELGVERTFEQDPKYALRLLVDIAIKALSPAINDPTTAVQALDQIEDLLLRLGSRRLEAGDFCDNEGAVRLVMPLPSWEDFLRLSLDEIRYCGASSVQVMRRMKALIENLLTFLPAERHEALRDWERRLQGTIRRTFADADEKHDASVADRQGLGIEKPQVSL